jgi:hypothetical protein
MVDRALVLCQATLYPRHAHGVPRRIDMAVNPQHFVRFLERIGHTVREASGLYWCNTQRGVYSSFPYHRDVDATTVDLGRILKRDGLVARFGCPVEQGIESFRLICDHPDYDFPLLRSRTRTQVRRGLEACRIEQVDFSLLQQQAIPLNADTLVRQGRKVPSNLASYWTRYYHEAAQTEGAEAWAAFVGDSLAAYLISFTIEDVANLLIVRSSLQFLDAFPNNALLYRFVYDRMRSGDVKQISYGYESIQAGLGSLDQFKTGMGFRQAPAGQRIELAGWVRPLVNRFTMPMAERVLKRCGEGETIAKLNGILQWYREQPALDADFVRSRAA